MEGNTPLQWVITLRSRSWQIRTVVILIGYGQRDLHVVSDPQILRVPGSRETNILAQDRPVTEPPRLYTGLKVTSRAALLEPRSTNLSVQQLIQHHPQLLFSSPPAMSHQTICVSSPWSRAQSKEGPSQLASLNDRSETTVKGRAITAGVFEWQIRAYGSLKAVTERPVVEPTPLKSKGFEEGKSEFWF